MPATTLPADVIEKIVSWIPHSETWLTANPQPNLHSDLALCALVARAWVEPTRRRLFGTVNILERRTIRKCRTGLTLMLEDTTAVAVLERSIASYIRVIMWHSVPTTVGEVQDIFPSQSLEERFVQLTVQHGWRHHWNVSESCFIDQKLEYNWCFYLDHTPGLAPHIRGIKFAPPLIISAHPGAEDGLLDLLRRLPHVEDLYLDPRVKSPPQALSLLRPTGTMVSITSLTIVVDFLDDPVSFGTFLALFQQLRSLHLVQNMMGGVPLAVCRGGVPASSIHDVQLPPSLCKLNIAVPVFFQLLLPWVEAQLKPVGLTELLIWTYSNHNRLFKHVSDKLEVLEVTYIYDEKATVDASQFVNLAQLNVVYQGNLNEISSLDGVIALLDSVTSLKLSSLSLCLTFSDYTPDHYNGHWTRLREILSKSVFLKLSTFRVIVEARLGALNTLNEPRSVPQHDACAHLQNDSGNAFATFSASHSSFVYSFNELDKA